MELRFRSLNNSARQDNSCGLCQMALCCLLFHQFFPCSSVESLWLDTVLHKRIQHKLIPQDIILQLLFQCGTPWVQFMPGACSCVGSPRATASFMPYSPTTAAGRSAPCSAGWCQGEPGFSFLHHGPLHSLQEASALCLEQIQPTHTDLFCCCTAFSSLLKYAITLLISSDLDSGGSYQSQMRTVCLSYLYIRKFYLFNYFFSKVIF